MRKNKQPLTILLLTITTLSLLTGCPSTEDTPAANSSPKQEQTEESQTTDIEKRAAELAENPNISQRGAELMLEMELAKALPEEPWTMPGWLALGTKPQQQANYPFSPTNSEAEIAIFSDEWSEVPTGAVLIALTPSGNKQQVQFQSSTNKPYGCDDIPTPMATFTAPQELPEGGFWVLPVEDADRVEGVALKDLSLDDIPADLLSPEKRQPTETKAWQAEDIIILLTKETNKETRLTVFNNSREIYSISDRIPTGYQEAINLSLSSQPGIPQPLGVFKFRPVGMPIQMFGAPSSPDIAITLWRPSLEGHNFEVLVLGSESTESFDAGSVYYCGF
jgi:hypothetical protein